MFKPKLLKKQQGFTLVEVLVAILIATIFITITMQMMVIASVFKVKAQENAEAINWIQEDLENVKYQADKLQLDQTTLTANAAKDVTSITVASGSMFSPNDTLTVGLEPIVYKVTAISGNTLTIDPKLDLGQVTGTAVISTKMCNPQGTNARINGLADKLRDTITGSNKTVNSNDVDNPPSSGNNQSTTNAALSSKLFTNKQYTLRRTTTLANNSPYNILQLKYKVLPVTSFDSSTVIARFDTEVIPNVAFQCPQ